MNTMQQEFNAVVQHLYKQGRPAADGNTCKYRSDEGLMCAVGCRIPSDVYSEDMEGKVVAQLVERFAGVLPPEISTYEDMFDDLQWAHDCWTDSELLDSLRRSLAGVAQKYDITFNDPWEPK